MHSSACTTVNYDVITAIALQDPTARIFFVLSYEGHARAFLCEVITMYAVV